MDQTPDTNAVTLPGESKMDGSVSISFIYSRDEYVRAMRRHFQSTLGVRRDIVGGLLAILIGVYLALATEFGWIAGIMIALGSILLAMVAYGMLLLPGMIYNSQPKLKNKYTLSFTDDGIHFLTNNVDSTLKWSLYDKWLFDDRFYVMYYGKRNLTVIPRRALTENGADAALRQLLTKHIGEPKTS